jgi:hypothetical protein
MPVEQLAEELGATLSRGINWTWAVWPAADSTAETKARQFEAECRRQHLETRGVYPPHGGGGWGVRFR